MNNFKEGQVVRIGKNCTYSVEKNNPRDVDGIILEATTKMGGGEYRYKVQWGSGVVNQYYYQRDLESVTRITMSNIIEKFKLITKTEPDKSAIKAGIRTTGDVFTSDGQTLFMEYLYQQNKDDFDKVVVQPILVDVEKDNK